MATIINSPQQLWDMLGLKEQEAWPEFKKRLLQNNSKPIVYEREGLKMLNVYLCRGFKRVLAKDGVVTKARWNQILSYFLPIVHKEKSKYQTELDDDVVPEGFTLNHIAATLDLPAFLGPVEDDYCKKILSEKSTPGEHVYRFSSTQGQFVMHVLGDDRQVGAYKIYSDKGYVLYLVYKNAKEQFKTLAELERKMPGWKSKFGIPFVDKRSDPFEALDSKEKELLEWTKKRNILNLYTPIMEALALRLEYDESLDSLAELKDDASFQIDLGQNKQKLEDAFKEEEDEESKAVGGKAAKPVKLKKKPVKKKEKVLV